jgi:3-hydroxypropanoate dehydrogenase
MPISRCGRGPTGGRKKETRMGEILNDAGLDTLFRAARTSRAWSDRPVTDVVLRALYDLMRWAPTCHNTNPARLIFVKTPEAKQRLAPALNETNRTKTMTAPVTAIVAYDLRFHEAMSKLNPDAAKTYAGNTELAAVTAFRNGSLQGAYMILAARALGLDCGPMSGFDNAALDAEFFPDGRCKSNFLCNLGYGDPAGLRPRAPRLEFEDACKVI